MSYQKVKKTPAANDEYSFSRGFEEQSSKAGFSHLSHAYRENFSLQDRQMMSHALNNRWLFQRPESYLERRFFVDNDRNSIPYTYSMNMRLHRRYKTNSLRPTDYTRASFNMQKDDGNFDLAHTKRALTFTSKQKEHNALEKLFYNLNTLKKDTPESEDFVSGVAENAAYAFQKKEGTLRKGNYDTILSENGIPSYDAKAALEKKGLSESVRKYGYEVTDTMDLDSSGEKTDRQLEKLNSKNETDRQKESDREYGEPLFSQSKETDNEYAAKKRERIIKDEIIKKEKTINARERLSAYTAIRSSVYLGMNRDSKRQLNYYNNIMGNVREEYHSQLDPKEEFSANSYSKLSAFMSRAKNVSEPLVSHLAESIQEKESEDIKKSVKAHSDGMFTDFSDKEIDYQTLPDSILFASNMSALRYRQMQKRLEELKEYVPERKKGIINDFQSRMELKRKALKKFFDENPVFQSEDIGNKSMQKEFTEDLSQKNEDSALYSDAEGNEMT